MTSSLVTLCGLALLAAGCNGSKSSTSQEPAPPELAAEYKELVGGEFHLVRLVIDDCSLLISQGELQALERLKATATEEECAEGEALLSNSAWQGYEGVSASADSGEGGGGSRDADTADPEVDCEDCGSEPTGDVGGDPTSGSSTDAEGIVTVTHDAYGQKVFDADVEGAEGDLLAYFRDLHSKYGTF